MLNNKPKTKKKVISLNNQPPKKNNKSKKVLDNRKNMLENHNNPIYKKYLIEYQTFIKEKKKSDKSKKKTHTFEYTKDKLIKSNNTTKKIIELPEYLIINNFYQNNKEKITLMNKEICYIRNIIDFCKDEDIPEDIISNYESLNKEYRKLNEEQKIYEDCLDEINNIGKMTQEEIAEIESNKNLELRKNRDLYFMIQYKNNTNENSNDLIKEYLEHKKTIIPETKEKEIKNIDYLITKLPVINK